MASPLAHCLIFPLTECGQVTHHSEVRWVAQVEQKSWTKSLPWLGFDKQSSRL